jgi:hypothetical protein
MNESGRLFLNVMEGAADLILRTKAQDMTAPTTRATPKIALDQRAPS